MAHDVHQGMLGRDEYVLPQGMLPDALGCGVAESGSDNSTNNMLAVNNITQKRPIPLPTEIRDAKKSRTKSLQFICNVPDCGEKFNTQEYLSNHMKLHLGVKPFTCDLCSKVCQTESKLKAHEASHANDGVKPKCDICERCFSSRSALNKHKKMLHKPKPHICPHCHSGFEERKYMVIHAKRAHDVELPDEENEAPPAVSCLKPDLNSSNVNDCKEMFRESYPVSDSGNLHAVTTISNSPLDVSKEPVPTNSVMMQKKDVCAMPASASITCEFCTSTFPSVAYLEQHMAVHIGEKSCHSCGMTFSNRHDLTNHMKLHTLEADSINFVTPNFNNGSFSQFVPLPIQPGPARGPQILDKYVCVVCNEQFLNLGSLKRHQAKGHNTTVLSV